jgi:hypothetical protein
MILLLQKERDFFMSLTIGAVVFAVVVIFLAWKIIGKIVHVAVVALVLAGIVGFIGFHDIHLPKGIVKQGQTVLHSVLNPPVKHKKITVIHQKVS